MEINIVASVTKAWDIVYLDNFLSYMTESSEFGIGIMKTLKNENKTVDYTIVVRNNNDNIVENDIIPILKYHNIEHKIFETCLD